MGWTLIILVAVAAVLLVISIVTSGKVSSAKEKEIEAIYIANLNEMNEIKAMLEKLEYDVEILFKETGTQLTEDKRLLLRELLDLYTRKYSIESIAKKTGSTEKEVRQLLAPYMKPKNERRKLENENERVE